MHLEGAVIFIMIRKGNGNYRSNYRRNNSPVIWTTAILVIYRDGRLSGRMVLRPGKSGYSSREFAVAGSGGRRTDRCNSFWKEVGPETLTVTFQFRPDLLVDKQRGWRYHAHQGLAWRLAATERELGSVKSRGLQLLSLDSPRLKTRRGEPHRLDFSGRPHARPC